MTPSQSWLLCNHPVWTQKCAVHDTETQIENICIHVVTSHQVPRAQPCSLSAIFRHFWPHIRSFPFGSSLEMYKRPPTTPHRKKMHPQKQSNINYQSSRQYGLFGGPQVIATCFSKSLLLHDVTKLVFGGQRAIKLPLGLLVGVSRRTLTSCHQGHTVKILTNVYILLCPHNNNTPMFTTILIFLSQKQLYDTVTFIGLINFFDFQDVYVTALMPATDPWQH